MALVAVIVIAGLVLNNSNSQDVASESPPPVAETKIGEADAAPADAATDDAVAPTTASDPAKPGRPAAKGPIDRIARDTQPACGLADVVASFRVCAQHMRALYLVQIMFDFAVSRCLEPFAGCRTGVCHTCVTPLLSVYFPPIFNTFC